MQYNQKQNKQTNSFRVIWIEIFDIHIRTSTATRSCKKF